MLSLFRLSIKYIFNNTSLSRTCNQGLVKDLQKVFDPERAFLYGAR